MFIFFLLIIKTALATSLNDLQIQALLASNPKTKKPVDSIEEFLPLLPKEFLENFTFVYNSRSPFKSSISPEFPRVILFSKDSKMILTFTGNPNQPGFEILETLSFDNNTSRFTASIYELPAAFRLKNNLSAEQKNCALCHGKDTRPIFDSYPLWPGFYGSIRDTFPKNHSVGELEYSNYKKFLEANARKGVYRFLNFKSDSSVSPYLDPKDFNSKSSEGDLNQFKFLPNTRLGMALTELNRQRIFRKLKDSPLYKTKEKIILSELLGCKKSKVSKKLISAIKKNLFYENKERLFRLGVDPLSKLEKPQHMIELDYAKELAQLEWAAEQLQINRGDWSMALEPDSNSYFDGILSGIHNNKSYYLKEDLILEIVKNMAQSQPQYQKFFRPTSHYAYLGYPFGNKIDITVAQKICPLL